MEEYKEYATIFGAIASVIGALNLMLPKLTASDLQSIEIESLKKVVAHTEEIKHTLNEEIKKSKIKNGP